MIFELTVKEEFFSKKGNGARLIKKEITATGWAEGEYEARVMVSMLNASYDYSSFSLVSIKATHV